MADNIKETNLNNSESFISTKCRERLEIPKFQPIRGMRDFIGEESAAYLHVVNVLSKYATRYGFNFIETPILEFTNVFLHSLGEETDIVSKEMFSFKDRSNNNLSLRPEGTASSVRALLSNKLTQNLPQKWFYCGPMFRYDRPQKGRYRQFFQFGVEYFGSPDHSGDTEIIAFANDVFKELNIKTKLKINSVGDKETRETYQIILREYFSKYIEELSETSKLRLVNNPLRILDSKDPTDKLLVKNAPKISDYLTQASNNFFQKVLENLRLLNIDYEIDQNLVRGLDYYAHTAFEFEIELEGASLAIAGGGRYDGLVEQMGGPAIPAVGMAFGIDRMMVSFDKTRISSKLKIAVLNITDNENEAAWKLVQNLRSKLDAITLLPVGNFVKKLKFCDKNDINIALIIGEEELKENCITCKFLKINSEKKELKIKESEILSFLSELHF